jgi:flagellar basal-body rod protein FlgC
MGDILGIAASGFEMAQYELVVGANNIANAETPGYKAQRADLVDLSGGGVAVAGTTTDPTPGPILPDGSQGSNVDLVHETVNTLQARNLYTANAAIFRTADQMYGTLLNMLDNGSNGRDARR